MNKFLGPNLFVIERGDCNLKIYTSQKILKMENKHPEKLWSALDYLLENKKKFDFRNTLNHFIFRKKIQ